MKWQVDLLAEMSGLHSGFAKSGNFKMGQGESKEEVENFAQGSSGSPPLVGGFLLISVACS